RGAFKALADKIDPRSSNGAVFLGLNGLVVKSHGSTDPIGFAAAIDVAADVASADLVSKIVSDLDRLTGLKNGHSTQNTEIAESEAALS
ncbi:MAG: phosphate acyltransferase, partial [Parvibaculum sp.]|nr:phosphate acyltransferase [Parvibaculum sp.]